MDNQQGKDSVADVAWLAGFVDGEGTVTLSERRLQNHRISPHFMLCNTHFPSLDRAIGILAGLGVNAHVLQKSEGAGNRRPAGVIEVAGFERVRKTLSALLPHLCTKREQAETVLSFIERRRQQEKRTPIQTEDLDAVRKMRILNNRDWKALTDYTRGPVLEARVCKHCQQAFQPKQTGQIFCSVKCRQNKYLDMGPERECPRCGIRFKPTTRPQQVYCTTRCRMNAGQARYRAARTLMV